MNKENLSINEIINKIKTDTNNQDNIIYRKKSILRKNIYIIFNETIASSDKISDFVIRSLNKIYLPTYQNILNKISNFKYKEITTYEEIVYYLNSGFTILLISPNKYLALETRKDLSRGVSTPVTENTPRGALDAFTENIESNIGLLKRRIKSNDLWFKTYKLGKYTQTSTSLAYIKSIANENLVNKVDKLLKNIDIDGIIASGTIRNLIEKENKNFFPNIISAEKPYTAVKYLLQGNVIILIDNDPFVLILPSTLNDYFLSEEDDYNKSINVTITRIIRYLTFIITLVTPGIYIAITTFNQELIPTKLLVSIAAQRENVPFSAFFEAMLMTIAFEILRESDLKLPSFASSAISIVGALILGEAAVNAGIVSPIMIIVVAITSISSLIFVEPTFTNALRIYRFLFMIDGAIFGIHGILLTFIYLITKLTSYNFLDMPYLSPYTPPISADIKDSIVKFPTINIRKRNHLLTNNIIKNKTEELYD